MLLILKSQAYQWEYKRSIVRLLLNGKYPDDINQANGDGETSLIIAAKNDFSTVIILLQQNEINVNQQDKNGNTALHYAISAKGTKRTEALIAHGNIDINIKNNLGQTPLHLTSNAFVTQQLIQAGADENIRDNAGRLPSELREAQSICLIL